MVNFIPNLKQAQLKMLHKLLFAYGKHIHGEQALAAAIIYEVCSWIKNDID
jgi:hypothetical protein